MDELFTDETETMYMLLLRIETQVFAQMQTKIDENILTPPRTPDLSNRQTRRCISHKSI